MIDADHGWTFVPTTEELERLAKLPDCRPELNDPSPTGWAIIWAILLAMFWMALGLGWPAFRSWMR